MTRAHRHRRSRHGRVWARRRIAVMFCCVVGLVGSLVSSPANAADMSPATVSISYTSPAGSFSPNGDGQDDQLIVVFCLDAAANVTATAADPHNAVVRTFVDRVSFSAGCHYSDVVWDGRGAGGALAADGRYDINLVAVNASGTPTTAT